MQEKIRDAFGAVNIYTISAGYFKNTGCFFNSSSIAVSIANFLNEDIEASIIF